MTEREIFSRAREFVDTHELKVFLVDACAGDDSLLNRIMRLLQIDSAPDSVLDVPAIGLEAPPPRDEPDSFPFLEPATRTDSLGRIGQYEVLEVLGRGGFGIVFRALDVLLNRMVAVKVLSPELSVTSAARKRFLREATLFAMARHENIVQVYGIGEQPVVHLVMEYIPGETLQQRLDRTGPLATPEILAIGRQICEGLAAAHATGLIHRDIKPANVLLEHGPDILVKLTDFGLARVVDDASQTQSGIVAGTPMYMSPEQAKSERLDHRSDLFSLGSVLYTMACGHPPFRASNTPAVLKRVADDTPRPIADIIPEVPEWLCAIILKLHAKKPSERFQSAREVSDSLTRCQYDPPLQKRTHHYRIAIALSLILFSAGMGIAEYAGLINVFNRAPQSPQLNSKTVEPSLPDPTPPVSPISAPPTSGDPDRLVAEWVMSTGAWASIHGLVGDREFQAKKSDAIPQEKFVLTVINLNRNQKATDESLVVLQGLRHLEFLQLSNISVSGAVIPYFVNCQKLQKLLLYGTRLSDESLPQLAVFTELKVLSVKQTKVTEAGVRKLSGMLPNCTIEWDGGTIRPK